MEYRPERPYTIYRRLYNHRDFGQKYVRAFVYDPSDPTNAVLDAANMTEADADGQFTYDWQTPGDPSGLGRSLIIETVVYTSSAYTTRDKNYGTEALELFVIDRKLPPGGGADIDYKKLAKIVKAEIALIPKFKALSLSSVKTLIKGSQNLILKRVGGIKRPIVQKVSVKTEKIKVTTQEVDTAPIIKAIKDNKTEVDFKEVLEEIKKTSPAALTKILEDRFLNVDETRSGNKAEILNKIKENLDGIKENLASEFKQDREFRSDVEDAIFKIEEFINEKKDNNSSG